jgi:hypothetical protein
MSTAESVAPERNMEGGYIKLYRRSIDNPVFKGDVKLWSIWTWMLTTAQSDSFDLITKFGKIELDCGELLIAEAPIALMFGVSRRQVGQLLDRMISAGMVIRKRNSKCHRAGTVITIVKFKQYQWLEDGFAEPVIRKANDNRSEKRAENNKTLLYNNVEETRRVDYPRTDGADRPRPTDTQTELVDAVVAAGGKDPRIPSEPYGPPAPPPPEVLAAALDGEILDADDSPFGPGGVLPQTAFQPELDLPNLSSRHKSRCKPTGNAGFDEWYAAYPLHKEPGPALDAYGKALRKTDHATLLEGALRYARERAGKDPHYTKYPARWLNSQRWDDDELPSEQDRQNEQRRDFFLTEKNGAAVLYHANACGYAPSQTGRGHQG